MNKDLLNLSNTANPRNLTSSLAVLLILFGLNGSNQLKPASLYLLTSDLCDENGFQPGCDRRGVVSDEIVPGIAYTIPNTEEV